MAKKTEVVTEAAVTAASNKAVADGEKTRKAFAKSLKDQEYVPIQVSPLYRPYFGRVMTVTINGASIAIPCDGKTYKVPATFAEEIKIRIYRQDQLFAKKRRLSDVANNVESSPGELRIF
jgi:hypothetical protein